MNTRTKSPGGYSTVITYDNHFMTESAQSAASPLRHVIEAPVSKRAWFEVRYALTSFPLALAAIVLIVPTLVNGPLWALSAAAVRGFGSAARGLARRLLGEDIPAPPPFRVVHRIKVATPD